MCNVLRRSLGFSRRRSFGFGRTRSLGYGNLRNNDPRASKIVCISSLRGRRLVGLLMPQSPTGAKPYLPISF
jgi:hypothetical protein